MAPELHPRPMAPVSSRSHDWKSMTPIDRIVETNLSSFVKFFTTCASGVSSGNSSSTSIARPSCKTIRGSGTEAPAVASSFNKIKRFTDLVSPKTYGISERQKTQKHIRSQISIPNCQESIYISHLHCAAITQQPGAEPTFPNADPLCPVKPSVDIS